MKPIKKLLLLAVILLSATGFSRASAQSADSAAYKMTNKMKKEIGLTNEQYPQVLKVNQEFVKEASRINTEQGSRFQKMKAYQSVYRKRNAAMKEILTKDQYKTFEKMQREKRQKVRERRG